jgi:ferredoxin-NADP reductase
VSWARAVVRATCPESPGAVRLVLEVDGWSGHLAGQHVDLRLTAEDGYTAWRSYSIASAPEEALVSLVVQRVDAGEVSPYLISDVQEGDVLELRGPVGGHFVWRAALGGPVQLVAGGSGVVPFLSMLEHHRLSGSDAEVRLLYALRSPQDALGARVLAQVGSRVQVTRAYSRSAPADWQGPTGRLDGAVLAEHVWGAAAGPQTFVCGPTGFVEAVAGALVQLGHDPTSIKTERYGDAT